MSSSIKDYAFGNLISRGSYGSVFMAVDKDDDIYAIKVMERSKVRMDAMHREARIQAGLRHPNVVKLDYCFIDEEAIYMVMRYMDGGTVSEFLDKKKVALKEDEAKKIVAQLAAGVAYIHGQSIVHRDIKTCNLLMDSKGLVKIADFGTAAVIVEGRPVEGHVGSPLFMAPEVRALEPHSFPADMWSVAVTVLVIVCSPERVDDLYDELQGLIPARASPLLRDLLVSLLQIHPASRPTAPQVQTHPWLMA